MFLERLSYKVGPLLVCSDLDLGRVPAVFDKSAYTVQATWFTLNTFFHHGSLESGICLEYLPGKG